MGVDEFQTQQAYIRDQKREVAASTITQFFKRANWTVEGYNSTRGLLTKYKNKVNEEATNKIVEVNIKMA